MAQAELIGSTEGDGAPVGKPGLGEGDEMARMTSTLNRERYYEGLLDEAGTPKAKFEVLRSRLAADVKRLPDELQDGAYAVAVDALKGVIEAIGDAIEDVRPVGV